MVPFDSGKSLHRVFALEIKRLRKIFFFLIRKHFILQKIQKQNKTYNRPHLQTTHCFLYRVNDGMMHCAYSNM